ncbi:MAG: hypothetical protein AB1742_12725 [bacterium]
MRFPARREKYADEFTKLQKELDRISNTTEYNTIKVLLGEFGGVPSSDLEFMLEWHTFDTDIDMHVIQPNGAHAWYADPNPSGNGTIDVDDINGINDGDPAVEHYNVAPGTALSGNYDLWINY